MEATGSVCGVLEISLKQVEQYLEDLDWHEEPVGGEERTLKRKGQVCGPLTSPQQAEPSQLRALVSLYFDPLGSIIFDMRNFWLTSPVRLIKTCQFLARNPSEVPRGSG